MAGIAGQNTVAKNTLGPGQLALTLLVEERDGQVDVHVGPIGAVGRETVEDLCRLAVVVLPHQRDAAVVAADEVRRQEVPVRLLTGSASRDERGRERQRRED